MKNKIKELEEQINRWEYEYRILNTPTVSDEIFDITKKELEELSKKYPEYVTENSPINKIGEVLTDGFKKVKHQHIMGSLSNTYNEEEVELWVRKIAKLLDIKLHELYFTLEDKFDGISGSLIYDDSLRCAITRGNGELGDDITNNAKMVLNIPSYIENFTGEIRGEFVINKSDLHRVNELENADFKNVRNLVSGTMKSLDSNVIRNRFVQFIPYYVYDKNHREIKQLSHERNRIENLFHVKTQNYCLSFQRLIKQLKSFEDKESDCYYKNRPYLVDGAVIKVADIDAREKLGYKNENPVWAIAYKFKQEKAITKVKSITWQVGRNHITPVAELESVELEGTTVSRATIHNVTQLKRLQVTEGCKVEIEKAGFIIPYINKVVEKTNDDIVIPEYCPSCQAKTNIVCVESEYLACSNDFCIDKLKSMVEYSIRAIKIDSIGESLISELVDKKIIKKPIDIFTLKYNTLMTLDRMGKTKANKILKNIQTAIIQPLNKIIEFLGIDDVGKSNSEKLAQQFKSFKEFVEAESFENIENIGEKTIQKIKSFIQNNKDYLSDVDDTFIQRKNEGFSNLLEGLRFVVTGGATKPRGELEAIITKNGGKVSSSVSNKTDILIIGSKESDSFNSSKKKKAIELSIPIHDEFYLFDRVNIKYTQEKEVEKTMDVNNLF